ncbi:GerMN domain-containing protein [Geodermatophilus amargosae]|uniref:GerMN domain-containing protein n=1 Tax=Geodermatophilus amargosae TaxID=1296565 RepID=UPI0034DE5F2C
MRAPARLVTVATLVALAGCGVSTGGAPEAIAPSDVPYGLLSSAPTSTAPSPVPPLGDRPRVYLLTPDDVVVPTGRDVAEGDLRTRLDDLLAQLAAGPTSGERDGELTTALAPGVGLAVAAVDGDTVTIDLTGPGEVPSGLQSRLAVAQIVLTATSLPEVEAVLLTRDGDPLEAPLPSGELSADPLEAADYDPLLVSPPS